MLMLTFNGVLVALLDWRAGRFADEMDVDVAECCGVGVGIDRMGDSHRSCESDST